MELPDGTTIDIHSFDETEDGRETDYWVWEETPPATPDETEEDSEFGPDFAAILSYAMPMAHDYDLRETTLQLELKTLKVHHVEAANYKTASRSVKRHRSEKTEPPF